MSARAAWSICWLCILVMAPGVLAEQMRTFGDYEVHYVVVGTTFLTPEVAAGYGIERARELALVNVSVLNKGTPTNVSIEGSARDLMGREFPLEFREIRDGASIYYLATLRYTDQEHWRFNLNVVPPGAESPLSVQFRQQLYRE